MPNLNGTGPEGKGPMTGAYQKGLESDVKAEAAEEEENFDPIDSSIDLKKAAKRVVDSLQAAEKFRTTVAEPSLGLSYEQLWNEEEMIRYAISTLVKKDANLSDYYDPLLYIAGKRIIDKAKIAVFEGNGDDYYTVEPENDEDKIDKQFAKKAKGALDAHLPKSRYKQWAKKLIYDSGFIDIAIGKMVPDKRQHPIYYRAKPGDKKPTKHMVTDSHIALKNVDVQNFYVENPFEPDLQKNNVTESYESNTAELKSLERQGFYKHTEDIKAGVLKTGGISNQFKEDRRQKLGSIKDNAVLVAEYWGELEVDEEIVQVNIVMAGDTVIKAVIVDYWHGQKPYIVFRWEEVTDSFYGFSLIRRWIRSQFVYNQAYNLDIRGSILRASGVGIANAQAGATLKRQMPNGKVSSGQILLYEGNKSVSDVYQQMNFPDVHPATEGIRQTVRSSVEEGISSKLLSGGGTGTQLDRTASGYGQALQEALSSVREIIYVIQDDLIAPTITMFYQLLGQYIDEATKIKVDKKPVTLQAADIFGMVHITVIGGSKYLENEKDSNNLLQAMEVVKGITGATEDIDMGELLAMYLESKGIDYEDVKKSKTPQQLFAELLKFLTPQQIAQLAAQAEEQKQEMLQEREFGKDHKAKQDVINEHDVDKRYQQVVEGMATDKARANVTGEIEGE